MKNIFAGQIWLWAAGRLCILSIERSGGGSRGSDTPNVVMSFGEVSNIFNPFGKLCNFSGTTVVIYLSLK